MSRPIIKFDRTVTMATGHSFSAEDLTRFLAEINAAGMAFDKTVIRWNAYAGDQRDPATITFTATSEDS